MGEGLEEGAAARGAGLVEDDRGDDPLPHPQELHVLAADVEDGPDTREDGLGSPAVGDGLHLALVGPEGGLDEGLTVAGGAGAGYPGPGREEGVEALQCLGED